MSQTFAYIREQVVQGVARAQMPNPLPLDRIRMQFDAAFFSVNSQTAESFAARQSNRELLRVSRSLSFVSGSCAAPTDMLKKYTEDCTFVVSGQRYSFRRYPQWVNSSSAQLGLWTLIGETLKAKTKIPVTTLTATVTFSAIESPPVPASESATFVAPDDYYPDFINAMIQFILGQTADAASQTA